MIWLALAAQLSAPLLLKPLLTPSDAPISMLKENVLQTVRIAVTVKPDGKVLDCRVEESSGNPKLDSYTCKVVSRRARFGAPTHADGSPAYGIYRTTIEWWVGDGYPPSRSKLGDLYLTVSALPPDVRSPATVRLKFAVDETGNASQCVAEEEKYDPALVAIACEQLLKSYKPSPARNAEGVFVPSIQSATVLFRTN